MMRRVAPIVLLLAGAVRAQSPLVVAPTGGALHTWTVPATSPQTFFDLTVHATITLRALATPLTSAIGQQGTIELWLTNPGITTWAGSETNAGNWHRAASGAVVANGTTGSIAQLTCVSCQDTGTAGLVLQPGTYGCAVRYGGVANLFYGVPAVPNVFANAELTLTGGAIQYAAFTTPTSGAGSYAGWSWYGSIHYAPGAVPHACATARSFGAGCLRRHTSIYQHFTTAAAAAAALDGRSLSFLPNGAGGYTVMPGLGYAAYVPPSVAALLVPVAPDGEYQRALTTPFPHPGGSATTLFIHANGYVSLASNNVLAGPNWLPAPPPFLNAPATGWWAWHDLAPTTTGSGAIWFEESPTTGLVRVTWLDVESGPATVANPSTFQFVFDPGTGIVTMNFVAIDAIGGASNPPGDGWVVGYSPGGPSPDPSPTDLAALMTGAGPIVSLPANEVLPLALAANDRPLLGTTIGLVTSNEPGPGLGVAFFGLVALDPGLPLAFLGAPGCSASIDVGAAVGVVITNAGAPGMSAPLPIPNDPGLLGVLVHAQTAWLDATANALGVITSNGVSLKLGNY